MAINKVEINGEVKLDLTQDTVSEDTLLQGTTAHDAAGNPIEGKVVTTPVPKTSNLLKGDGAGGVTAAMPDTDYLAQAPVTSVNGKTGDVTVSEMPSVTASDNSKVATVVNGVWSARHPTAYRSFIGASASGAGATGLVPSPKKGQQNRYLKGDGTWADVLPQVAASDNGKFLRVVSGAWAAQQPTTEAWIFTLEDGSTITKNVCIE